MANLWVPCCVWVRFTEYREKAKKSSLIWTDKVDTHGLTPVVLSAA